MTGQTVRIDQLYHTVRQVYRRCTAVYRDGVRRVQGRCTAGLCRCTEVCTAGVRVCTAVQGRLYGYLYILLYIYPPGFTSGHVPHRSSIYWAIVARIPSRNRLLAESVPWLGCGSSSMVGLCQTHHTVPYSTVTYRTALTLPYLTYGAVRYGTLRYGHLTGTLYITKVYRIRVSTSRSVWLPLVYIGPRRRPRLL